MNGCISTNLEVVSTDSAELTVCSGLRLRATSQYENGSCVKERFGVRCAFFFFISIILVQLRLHKEFLVSRLPVEELLSTILTLS